MQFILQLVGRYSAQESFEVPQHVILKTEEDYRNYEKDIVMAAKWLEETDLDKDFDKRKAISAFVLQWASGSNSVEIEISEQLMKIIGKNNGLLAVYIAAYSRYCILNKAKDIKPAATKSALVAIMKVYKKGIEIKKNKEMERIIKLNDVGLDVYIRDKMK